MIKCNVTGLAMALVVLATGCTTFSEDGGFTPVSEATKSKLDLEPMWVRNDSDRQKANSFIREILSTPLDAQGAAQVALLGNPALQAEYANLGMAEANLVQAGRIPNPGFSFGRTSSDEALEIERGLHFNIMSVLTLPARVGIETRRFEAAKFLSLIHI